MPIYAITYDHPDEEGWKQHLMPHIAWLKDRVQDGALLASGPFAIEGLIANMTVREWDPIFGAFNTHSSMPV